MGKAREKMLRIRVDLKEEELIKDAAAIEELPVATYLRRLALNDAKAKGFSLK